MTDVNQLLTEHLDIWTSAIEKKSSAGRGNGGAVSLVGIKKLRELILELAVRGKLSQQKAEDGTALEVLTSTQSIRNDLFLQKRIRNQKSVGPVSAREARFEIPHSWAWTRLSDLAEIAPKNEAADDEIVSFVPMPEITTSHTGEHGYEDRTWGEIKKGYTHFADGDIALAKITPCFENSKAAVFSRLKGGIGAGTTELHVARLFSDSVVARFILLHLKAPSYIDNGEKVMTGSAGQKRVPRSYFTDTPIALPPTAEQRRIVAKVDELMALCDALERQTEDSLKAHQILVETCLATLTNSQSSEELSENWARIETHFDTLFTTEESITSLKETILELALQGVLTKQLEQDIPAEKLLARLYGENKRKATSRHRTILSKINERKTAFEIPAGWQWAYLGKLASDLRYGTSKKCGRDESLTPVLRIPNVSGGRVSFEDMKYGSLEGKELDDLRLQKGDLLVIRSNGSLDIVGRFAVVPELDQDYAFAGYLVRLRIDPDSIVPQFLWYASNSKFIRDQIELPIRHGVGLKNVNSTELASLTFPIPPYAEQLRIVAELDRLFELCDKLSRDLAAANTLARSVSDTLTSKIH